MELSPDLIFQYFPDLDAKQRSRIEALMPLYQDWNAKINVVSRQDIDQLYLRHVLHSLAIAKVIQFKPGSIILDVGTGGGFPGIPLAILYPEVRFHLVDSIRKKTTVVEGVASELKLDNVSVHNGRAEQVDIYYDFCVSRAVAPLTELLSWTRKRVSQNQFHDLRNGLICLKGGDLAEEIAQSKIRGIRSWGVDSFFPFEFFAGKKVLHVPL